MNPWPAPSVPKPDKQKHRRRRQAGGSDTGTVVPKGGAAKDEPCNGASRGPGHTGDGQRSAPGEGAGPPGLRLLAESPAVGASWDTGITRAISAQESITQAATRRLPNHKTTTTTTCRPPCGRPLPAQGSSPAWAETRSTPPRGSVARGVGPSDRARSEGGGRYLGVSERAYGR